MNPPIAHNCSGLLAVVETQPTLTAEPPATHSGKEMFFLMGMLTLVALGLLLMVVFMRCKKIRRLNHLSRSAWPASASKNQNPDGETIQPRESRRHRRHRRREHRPRNPSLAETGGLPSKRPEDEPPPAL